MQYSIYLVSAIAGLSAAAQLPDTTKFPTPGSDNPITAPLNEIVPAGKPFTIKWTPTNPSDKVTLYLLKGPSTDARIFSTIADSIPNNGAFTWTPDAGLAPTADAHGYGIELVVEGTGQYQYSTQIGISKAEGVPDVSSSSKASVETAPPAGQTQGTAYGGALAETKTVGETKTTVVTDCSTSIKPTAAAPFPTATGGKNGSVPIVSPTGPVTVPSSLATIAQPAATPAAGTPVAAGTPAAAGPANNGTIAQGAAAGNAVQLTGAFAAVAGLLSFFLL